MPQPSSQRRPVRLAFIGTGNWARRYHLPSLQYIRQHAVGDRDVVLHGIYGPKRHEADELAARYAFERVYATLDELIEDRDVDAVAMVISPEAVRDVIVRVLEKRVPVFTEKPPGANYAEAQELAGLVRVPNVVAFNRRYGVLNNRFRELVGQSPGIVTVRGAMYRKNRREPHFVLHTGPHLVNFMEYLFGPIKRLRNERQTYPATGEMMYVAHVRFESGLDGQVLFAPCSDRHWEGIEVQSEDRTLILHSPHNDAPGEIVIRRQRAGREDGQVIARSGEQIPILEEGYVWEHVDFLRSATGGEPPRSTFQNAANTMRIVEAIETGADL